MNVASSSEKWKVYSVHTGFSSQLSDVRLVELLWLQVPNPDVLSQTGSGSWEGGILETDRAQRCPTQGLGGLFLRRCYWLTRPKLPSGHLSFLPVPASLCVGVLTSPGQQVYSKLSGSGPSSDSIQHNCKEKCCAYACGHGRVWVWGDGTEWWEVMCVCVCLCVQACVEKSGSEQEVCQQNK